MSEGLIFLRPVAPESRIKAAGFIHHVDGLVGQVAVVQIFGRQVDG